jgi:hypothetical protein
MASRFDGTCLSMTLYSITSRTLQTAVELHAADAGEVVAVVGVEQAVEEDFDRFFRRRLAGAHHAIDGDARSLPGNGFVARSVCEMKAPRSRSLM